MKRDYSWQYLTVFRGVAVKAGSGRFGWILTERNPPAPLPHPTPGWCVIYATSSHFWAARQYQCVTGRELTGNWSRRPEFEAKFSFFWEKITFTSQSRAELEKINNSNNREATRDKRGAEGGLRDQRATTGREAKKNTKKFSGCPPTDPSRELEGPGWRLVCLTFQKNDRLSAQLHRVNSCLHNFFFFFSSKSPEWALFLFLELH